MLIFYRGPKAPFDSSVLSGQIISKVKFLIIFGSHFLPSANWHPSSAPFNYLVFLLLKVILKNFILG